MLKLVNNKFMAKISHFAFESNSWFYLMWKHFLHDTWLIHHGKKTKFHFQFAWKSFTIQSIMFVSYDREWMSKCDIEKMFHARNFAHNWHQTTKTLNLISTIFNRKTLFWIITLKVICWLPAIDKAQHILTRIEHKK